MMNTLGMTRSKFARHHALIAPDSHEAVTLPDWPGASLVHLITPAMGADFSMFCVHTDDVFSTTRHSDQYERFILVRQGHLKLRDSAGDKVFGPDDYVFLPASHPHRISTDGPVKLLVLERPYVPRDGVPSPAFHSSTLSSVPSKPLKGDMRLQVQKLLPEGPEWDMEINTMCFQPGASLPYVETHFMEHGLLMLEGGGIYRLEDDWYPVAAGDAIWMGPFCPQWFGAIGHENARYLIYKNWNRDPLIERQRS